MPFIRVNTGFTNTITEVSNSPIVGLQPDEFQASVVFNFPPSQPVYFYKYNDISFTVEVNSTNVIETYEAFIDPLDDVSENLEQIVQDLLNFSANTQVNKVLLISTNEVDLNQAVETPIVWDNTVRNDGTALTVISGGSAVQINEDGRYNISFIIPLKFNGTSNDINNIATTVFVNDEQRTSSFIQTTVTKGNIQTAILIPADFSLQENDVITIKGFSLSGGEPTVNVAGSTVLIIEKINI
jgi:stage V sporulation protein SpoVS